MLLMRLLIKKALELNAKVVEIFKSQNDKNGLAPMEWFLKRMVQ